MNQSREGYTSSREISWRVGRRIAARVAERLSVAAVHRAMVAELLSFDTRTLGKPKTFTGQPSEWTTWQFTFKAFACATHARMRDVFELENVCLISFVALAWCHIRELVWN